MYELLGAIFAIGIMGFLCAPLALIIYMLTKLR
jgi:hypothetical protein